MDRKLFVFIVIATLLAALIWIAGEAAIIMVLKMGKVASIVWSIIVVAGLITINVLRSLRDDNSRDRNNRNW